MPRIALVLVILVLTTTPGITSPCRDNGWQPTFVHDLVNGNPVPYYVMPDGSFVALTGDWANQSGPGMCCLYGVRDRRGFTTCFEYTRVQCGCDMQSLANDTCRRFLAEQGVTGAGGSSRNRGPTQWNECETSEFGRFCGTWTMDWPNGLAQARWPNGSSTTLVIESITGSTVVIRREDDSGLRGTYRGSITGNTVSGTFTFYWTQTPEKIYEGTWEASW